MHQFPLWKKTLFYGVLVLMPLLIAAVVLEGGVRLVPPVEYNNPGILRAKRLQYAPSIFSRHVFSQEEVRTKWNGLTWNINSKGYRGRDFELEKTPGTLRIIIYGGSAVFDINANEGEDWPHLVEEILKQSGFENVELINAGIPGHASFDSVGRLYSEGHTFDPDYVLLYNSWNDLKYLGNQEPILRSFTPYEPKLDPRLNYHNGIDQFLTERSHVYSILRRIYYKATLNTTDEGLVPASVEEKGLASDISGLEFKQFQLNVEMFVDLARNIGAEPVLMTQGRLASGSNSEGERSRIAYEAVGLEHGALVEAFATTDQIILDVAKAKNVRVIDASSQLSGNPDLFGDHVHLSNEGSRKLAELTAEELGLVLRARLP